MPRFFGLGYAYPVDTTLLLCAPCFKVSIQILDILPPNPSIELLRPHPSLQARVQLHSVSDGDKVPHQHPPDTTFLVIRRDRQSVQILPDPSETFSPDKSAKEMDVGRPYEYSACPSSYVPSESKSAQTRLD